MALPESMRSMPVTHQTRRGPVWAGPSGDGPNGGVTQSLLSKFLVCRERFRLQVVEGLRPVERFNHRAEYGNMWHVCEEAVARAGGSGRGSTPLDNWGDDLEQYCQQLLKQHPYQQEEVRKWFNVCRVQFPLYVQHWAAHPDVTRRTPLLAEQVFDVAHRLPSGRTVRLRGKWDSVDLVDGPCATCGGSGQTRRHCNDGDGHVDTFDDDCDDCEGTGKGQPGIWLQENKTKGDVDEALMRRQLTGDLQTMMYLIALKASEPTDFGLPDNQPSIAGIRYNVIRRPLSGGKGTIVRKEATEGSKCTKCKGSGRCSVSRTIRALMDCPKCLGKGRIGAKPAESEEAYYSRLAQYIKDEPDSYFMRWQVKVSQADIDRFQRECLDPILEQLCWWWDVTTGKPDTKHNRMSDLEGCLHFRMPYGIYSPLLDGGMTDLDAVIESGSTAGLRKVTNLFPELQEG